MYTDIVIQNECKQVPSKSAMSSIYVGHPHREGRTILTDDQARAIFRCKPSEFARGRCKSTQVALVYGVSPKTVRDIWVGRTWYRATCHLDLSKPICAERLEKKRGRPKGAKDIKPRTRSLESCFESKNIATVAPYSRTTETSVTTSSFDNAQELETEATILLEGIAGVEIEDNNVQPTMIGADYCSEVKSWSALPFEIDSSLEFVDPFHDDWAFWPKQEHLEPEL